MERTLVLVTGAGRSGTSAVAGSLARLGVHVPGPFLDANPTNPKGFYESRWSMRFHNRLLERAHVSLTDARPEALAAVTAELRPRHRERVTEWHNDAFADGPPVVVLKDPRTLWTLDLWRSVAEGLDVRLVTLTMMRHPAEVLGSRLSHYAGRDPAIERGAYSIRNTAGWVTMLVTERQTRGHARSFVRYDDLLDDWRTALQRASRDLDVDLLANAPEGGDDEVDAFLDPDLSRHQLTWDDVAVPAALREVAESVWQGLSGLADGGEPELDRTLERYQLLYDEARHLVQDVIRAEVSAAEQAESRRGPRAAGRPSPPSTPGTTGLRRVLARLGRR
jgi:hypothetical protein